LAKERYIILFAKVQGEKMLVLTSIYHPPPLYYCEQKLGLESVKACQELLWTLPLQPTLVEMKSFWKFKVYDLNLILLYFPVYALCGG
jgi:hypothetical protein